MSAGKHCVYEDWLAVRAGIILDSATISISYDLDFESAEAV